MSFSAKFLQHQISDMLPGQVVAYDRATNMASVQPLVSMVTTLNQIVPRGQIASVPVLQVGRGILSSISRLSRAIWDG